MTLGRANYGHLIDGITFMLHKHQANSGLYSADAGVLTNFPVSSFFLHRRLHIGISAHLLAGALSGLKHPMETF